MTSHAAAGQRSARHAFEALAVAAAMASFALFAHRGMPGIAVSGAGLFAAAAVIGYSLRGAPTPQVLLGLGGDRSRLLSVAIAGIAIGIIAGILQRNQSGVLPESASGVHLFVVIACLIGITEELVYRGWMLGRLSALGWPAAVVLTAAAHAIYKAALFARPPGSETVVFDLGGIALWTVVGGIVLGILRRVSRSVLPAVLAHAAFDAVVYSGYGSAPWWVWN